MKLTHKQAAEFLNNLLNHDPELVKSILEAEFSFNTKPNIDGLYYYMDKEGTEKIRFLGILNAMFGVNKKEDGFIAAIYNDNNKILRFEASDIDEVSNEE